jgi:thioredoxin reductase
LLRLLDRKHATKHLDETHIRNACERKPYLIEIDAVCACRRTVIVATGAAYQQPSLENLSQFKRAGVDYGPTFMEAQL